MTQQDKSKLAGSIQWHGDRAALVPCRLDEFKIGNLLTYPWVRNVHPAFESTLVEIAVDSGEREASFHALLGWWIQNAEVADFAISPETSTEMSADDERIMRVPVCYDAEFGLDLQALSEEKNISIERIINLHTTAKFRLAFFGFSPGFPYLEGLPDSLHTSRLKTARTRVPAGSVALAGNQAGIYPQETPGGWKILGRTPLKIFDPSLSVPTPFRIGQEIQFYSISAKEFMSELG